MQAGQQKSAGSSSDVDKAEAEIQIEVADALIKAVSEKQ